MQSMDIIEQGIEQHNKRMVAYVRACVAQEDAEEAASRAADERAKIVCTWHDEGFSYAQLARMLTLSRSRVQQLVERGRTARGW